MKTKLFLLSLIFLNSAFAADLEMSEAEAKMRAKALDSIKFTPSADHCKENKDKVIAIQGLISGKSEEEKANSIFALEKEADELRAEQVLINGIKALNDEYKKFLDDISQAKIPGLDDSGEFTLENLKSDLEESGKHLDNVRSMAVMDRLLKEAIKNPESLIEEQVTGNAELAKDAAALAGKLDVSSSSSGGEVYDKLLSSCQNGNSSSLCKIMSKASPESKEKVKATVEGFVNAYRLSTRSTAGNLFRGLGKALTLEFSGDLEIYRNALLDGITKVKPSEIAGEIEKFEDAQADLAIYADSSPKFNSLKGDIEKYKMCLVKQSIGNGSSSCSLSEEHKDFTQTLTSIGEAQANVVNQLGGDNSKLQKDLESAHRYDEASKKFAKIQEVYKDDKVIGDAIAQGIKENKDRLLKVTKNIFKNVQIQRGSIEGRQKILLGDKFEDPRKEDLKKTNIAINEKLNSILDVSCAGDQEGDLEKACEEASNLKGDAQRPGTELFQEVDGQIVLNQNKVDDFLTLVGSGELSDSLKSKQDELDTKVKDNSAKLLALKNSSKYKKLNNLLAFYGNLAASFCKGEDQNLEWKCVQDNENENDKVYALVDRTGDILGRMAESPQRLAISDLNSKCDLEFIESFKQESENKFINGLCTDISTRNENYVQSLEPTPEEKIYPYTNRYWDGKQWVAEKRQRKRWALASSVAEKGLEFLPWELNRQMQMSQVTAWETSTIGSIKYRNSMLSNYYSNIGIMPGHYYGGGYFGGSLYNNNYSTVGAGGYFPMTTSAGGATGAGFDFSSTGI